MKRSDCILVALFIIFATTMSKANTLSFYTPRIIIGGMVATLLIYIACRVQYKGIITEDAMRKKRMGKIALSLRIVSWLLFFFYLMMVVIGF